MSTTSPGNAQIESRHRNWMTGRWFRILQQGGADNPQNGSYLNSLDNAVVVEPEDIMPGRVQFGSLVTVFSTTEEEEQSFQIVSHDEAQAQPEGRLSCDAPLALVLFGKREGEVVQIMLSNGAECEYEVTHIRTPG